jgi:hypothetical protein
MIDSLVPVQTMFMNGAVRNAAGKLVAFYDFEARVLYVNGIVQEFRNVDMEQAMEIVGERAER